MKTEFKKCIEVKENINANLNRLSDILNSFPKLDGGLIPDNVRNSQNFKLAKQSYGFYFNKFREINSYINKNYKKEAIELALNHRFKKQL